MPHKWVLTVKLVETPGLRFIGGAVTRTAESIGTVIRRLMKGVVLRVVSMRWHESEQVGHDQGFSQPSDVQLTG